jgi:hypothetical protein
MCPWMSRSCGICNRTAICLLLLLLLLLFQKPPPLRSLPQLFPWTSWNLLPSHSSPRSLRLPRPRIRRAQRRPSGGGVAGAVCTGAPCASPSPLTVTRSLRPCARAWSRERNGGPSRSSSTFLSSPSSPLRKAPRLLFSFVFVGISPLRPWPRPARFELTAFCFSSCTQLSAVVVAYTNVILYFFSSFCEMQTIINQLEKFV